MVRQKNGFGECDFRRKEEQRADSSTVTSEQEVRQGLDSEYKQCCQTLVCEPEESMVGLWFLCSGGRGGRGQGTHVVMTSKMV